MGVHLHVFLAAILLVSTSSTQLCQRFSHYATEIQCEDLNLVEFPDFKAVTASTYKLSGNRFARITNTTFPRGVQVREIEIMRNKNPLKVDRNAFSHLSLSLTELKLQNVDFQFDAIFEPVLGLQSLNSLEIGSKSFGRNLTAPFLDEATMDRLLRLRVVHSAVVDVKPEALNSDFRRLRHLGFSHNKLQTIPEGIKRVMALRGRHQTFEIDVSYNFLYTVKKDWFPLGCSITSLDLSYNMISSVPLHSLENCPNLIKLVLKGNIDLLYLSPALFPNNCHQTPRWDVQLAHSGVRNIEFALRSCVRRVNFFNTSVPCTCRHMSILKCQLEASRELYGECLWRTGERLLFSDACEHWDKEGCFFPEGYEAYRPAPVPGAGDTLASLKDWGNCRIRTTTTTTTNTPTTTTVATTSSTAKSSTATTSTTTSTAFTNFATLKTTTTPARESAVTSFGEIVPTTSTSEIDEPINTPATGAKLSTPETAYYVSFTPGSNNTRDIASTSVFPTQASVTSASNVEANTEASLPPASHAEESETPASSTEASKTPASSTEASKTPASSTEANETPASGTETSETPASSTEASKTPASSTEASKTPASSTEANETPASGTETSETPASSTEASETPASSTEASETRASSTEESETPASSTEESETPASSTEANVTSTYISVSTSPVTHASLPTRGREYIFVVQQEDEPTPDKKSEGFLDMNEAYSSSVSFGGDGEQDGDIPGLNASAAQGNGEGVSVVNNSAVYTRALSFAMGDVTSVIGWITLVFNPIVHLLHGQS